MCLCFFACPTWKAWLCYGWLHEETQRAKPFNSGLIALTERAKFLKTLWKNMVKSHVQNLNANKICEIGQIIPTMYATYTNLLSIVWAAAAPSSQFTTGRWQWEILDWKEIQHESYNEDLFVSLYVCLYVCMYVYVRRLSLLLCQNSLPSKRFLQPEPSRFSHLTVSEQCCTFLKQSVTISHFPEVCSNLKQINLQTRTQEWHQVLRKLLGRMATTRSFSFEYEIMIPTSQLLIIWF